MRWPGGGRGQAPALYRMALRAVALAVPSERRSEWLTEWESELWYVWRAVSEGSRVGGREHAEVARFCGGAIEDVRCLRRLSGAPPVRASGSAVSCAAWLVVGALACFGLAKMLPGVGRAVAPATRRSATDVVTISPAGLLGSELPPNRLGEVRGWERRSQHLFAEFAFYAPVAKAVHIGRNNSPELRLVQGSENLLRVLGTAVAFAPAAQGKGAGDGVPSLILTESAWRSRFGGGREIFGRQIKVGLETVRVGGVVPDETAPFPGQVEGFVLLPAAAAARLPDSARVFALGRVAAHGGAPAGQRWPMSVGAGTDHRSDYECEALSARGSGVWRLFVFAVLLALVSLPATRSLPLGEFAALTVRLPWMVRLRRGSFLLVKMGALLPAIFFGSMDVAYALPLSNPNTPQYLQLVTVFLATLFCLRWCLRDQRQRCPVCLGKLTCPVRVGHPSRNFLSWNGTELICSGGHGLLHVPELPTSWFGAPRWLHLDPSWSGLFLQVV